MLKSDGTFFITADFSKLYKGGDEKFCHYITTEAKVAAVPISVFYDAEGPTNLVRFCFSKRLDVLEEALKRLKKAFS